jgi:hypothetical protein
MTRQSDLTRYGGLSDSRPPNFRRLSLVKYNET